MAEEMPYLDLPSSRPDVPAEHIIDEYEDSLNSPFWNVFGYTFIGKIKRPPPPPPTDEFGNLIEYD